MTEESRDRAAEDRPTSSGFAIGKLVEMGFCMTFMDEVPGGFC